MEEIGEKFSNDSMATIEESTYEPPHDETNKMICTPSEVSDQPGHQFVGVVMSRLISREAWLQRNVRYLSKPVLLGHQR